MDSESYRGDGCLNTAIDFWSNATVLATEGRSPTTPTWTWKFKGMGLEREATTGKIHGKANASRFPICFISFVFSYICLLIMDN